MAENNQTSNRAINKPSLIEKLVINYKNVLVGTAIPSVILTFFCFGFLGYVFIIENHVVPAAGTVIVFLMYFLAVFTLIGIFYQLWHYIKEEPLYKHLTREQVEEKELESVQS
uniref:Group-specific protein n=1 Tax=Panagrellus redivivus TaxID=6233 RepID=A0A7E4US70_PANRE